MRSRKTNRPGREPLFLQIFRDGEDCWGTLQRGWHGATENLGRMGLGPGTELKIRDRLFTLGDLVGEIYQHPDSEFHRNYFSDRGQLDLGGYLYRQTLGRSSAAYLEGDQQLRVITQEDDEYLARLPWVLLARNKHFLVHTDWSIASAQDQGCHGVCELSRKPHLLAVFPELARFEFPHLGAKDETRSREHRSDLEELFSGRLTVVSSREEFFAALRNNPELLYFYGHGQGDFFDSGLKFRQEVVPLNEVDLQLRALSYPGSRSNLRIAYFNCCHGDAGGFLGAARQLGNTVPVVLSNRTYAAVDTAQEQARIFWHEVLRKGTAPHRAATEMYRSTGRLRRHDARWMTPTFHVSYERWSSTPPIPDRGLDLPPWWQLRLDRKRQFSQVEDLIDSLLEQRTAGAVVWYGAHQQGPDRFRERLLQELKDTFSAVPISPHLDELEQPYEEQLLKALHLEALHLPRKGNLIEQVRSMGPAGKPPRFLYISHHLRGFPDSVHPDEIRDYLLWWSAQAPLLLQARIPALLCISLEVAEKPWWQHFLNGSPARCFKNLEFENTQLRVLDELEAVPISELWDFVSRALNRPFKSQETRKLKDLWQSTGGAYKPLVTALNHWFRALPGADPA